MFLRGRKDCSVSVQSLHAHVSWVFEGRDNFSAAARTVAAVGEKSFQEFSERVPEAHYEKIVIARNGVTKQSLCLAIINMGIASLRSQ